MISQLVYVQLLFGVKEELLMIPSDVTDNTTVCSSSKGSYSCGGDPCEGRSWCEQSKSLDVGE